MRTGRSPAVSRYPAATCLVPELAGSVVHTCTVSVWPRGGVAVRIRCVRLRADSSHDYWYILRHQLRSRIRPMRQATIHLGFRGSVINRAIFGFHHMIFPVGLPSAAPPLPRKENPRSRAPICTLIKQFVFYNFYWMITLRPVAYLSPTRGLFPDNNTIFHSRSAKLGMNRWKYPTNCTNCLHGTVDFILLNVLRPLFCTLTLG